MINNLKKARKAVKLTQEAVADKLNVSQKAISTWETGLKEPSYATLIALADLYKVSIDYLLDHDTQPHIAEDELSPEELTLIKDYRELNTQGQDYIKQQVYMALQIYKKHSGLSSLESKKIV